MLCAATKATSRPANIRRVDCDEALGKHLNAATQRGVEHHHQGPMPLNILANATRPTSHIAPYIARSRAALTRKSAINGKAARQAPTRGEITKPGLISPESAGGLVSTLEAKFSLNTWSQLPA